MLYRVEWTIDINARNPREAARQARLIQIDASNLATFYQVRKFDSEEETVTINLEEG